jgi:cytosine/adenosine deaminase-related metal-dependent hydrolase
MAWTKTVNLLDFEDGRPVLRRGCLVEAGADGKIARLEPGASAKEAPSADGAGEAFELWMPGLANPHSHLELTGLEGVIPPTPSFPVWGRQLFAYKQGAGKDEAFLAAERGAALSLAAGVTAIGDICTNLAGPLALAKTPLRAVLFAEVIAVGPSRQTQGLDYFRHLLSEVKKVCAEQASGRLVAAISPHAPHTVMPEVMREVAENEARGHLATIHIAETTAEIDYLLRGEGEFREFFDSAELLPEGWTPPGEGPVACCDKGFLFRPREIPYSGAGLRERLEGKAGAYPPDTIIAHGNYLTAEEAELLSGRRAAVCWCPETHEYFSHSPWPRERNRHAMPALLGTDSLASAWSLDPPVSDLLQAVTLRARDCLFGREAGHPDADFTILRAVGNAADALRQAPSGEPLSEETLRKLFGKEGRAELRALGCVVGGEFADARTWRAKADSLKA